jgi:outer membrane receptor protein involved in Fe transport
VTLKQSGDYVQLGLTGYTIVPSITFSHADDNYTSILQFPGENYFTRDERDLLNVSVTYGFDDWTFQLFANNATDETYLENAGATALYGDPRTVGLRAKMNF